jgi:hypothetical protein
MKLIVSGRGFGKTTKMIEWLLEGHAIDHYPGWSRVIACADSRQVVHVTSLVKFRTAHEHSMLSARDWDGLSDTEKRRLRALNDLRKAVWGPSDLAGPGLRGVGDVELGIDNLEHFLPDWLRTNYPPTIATVSDWEIEQL